jgi:uncharacterized protein
MQGAEPTGAGGRSPTARVSPRVDHHQHLFSSEIAGLLASRSGSSLSPISASELVGILDAAGIERALVLSVAYLFGSPALSLEDEYLGVRRENDWTCAQASLSAGRLRSFCSFNPLKPYASDELARCNGTHHGLKLHLASSDVQLDVPRHVDRLQQVFAEANRARMPIVVHLRANIGKSRPYGAAQARIFIEEVLPGAPDVPVQIAHLAGTGPGYDDPPAGQALEAFVRAVEDRDRRVDKLWFDVAGLAHDGMAPAEARRMVGSIRRLGVRRVLFGSDAATAGNSPPREAWAALARLPFTDDEASTLALNVAPYARSAGRAGDFM